VLLASRRLRTRGWAERAAGGAPEDGADALPAGRRRRARGLGRSHAVRLQRRVTLPWASTQLRRELPSPPLLLLNELRALALLLHRFL